MSISSVARTGYTAHHDGRSSRTSSPLSFVGGAAIAFVTLACGWTLYSNVFGSSPFGADVDTVSAERRVVFVAASPGLDRQAFADRFSALIVTATATTDELPALTVEQKNYAALMDVTYSLGAPPAAFKPTVVEAPDTPKPAPSRAEIARAPDVALAPTPPARVANVPLPSARPSDFKFAKNRTAPNHIGMVERAKNAALAAMAAKTPSLFDKLFGRSQAPGPVLAYAGSDGGVMSDGTSATPGGSSDDDRLTAIYDISARTVYMPDGSKLEAHSGLGEKLDDPRYVNVRMHGATPPHIYDLKPREALFHGVAALRLTPVGGEGAIFGRTGLLAHTYMLGPNGDSNGCVSFKDYNAFLKAYRNGDVKRLVVVAKL
ncbi:DUF2778 domain-containing protein [soil metagenome]